MIFVFSLEDENSFQAVSRLHGQLSSLRGEGRGGLALALVGTQGKEGLGKCCFQGSSYWVSPNIGESLVMCGHGYLDSSNPLEGASSPNNFSNPLEGAWSPK